MFGQVTATGLTATFLLHLRRVFCLLWKNTAPRWTFLVALPSPWPLYVLSFVSRGIPVTTKAWAPPPPYHWSRKRKAVKKDGPSFQSTSKQSSARHVCSVSLLVQIKMLLSKNWWHCTGTKKKQVSVPIPSCRWWCELNFRIGRKCNEQQLCVQCICFCVSFVIL